MTPRFPLGRLIATPGALSALAEASVEPLELLRRHQGGDWGELDAHERRANERALKDGTRLLSSYTVDGETVWIITEADRRSTCLLLPGEY